MISKSFIKSSFIYSIVGSLPLAASVILLPFYGNTNLLSTGDFGLLAIYIAFSELIRVMFNFALDNYVGVHYIKYGAEEKSKRAYLGTAILFLLVFGLAALLITSIMGDWLFTWVFPGNSISFYPYGFLSVLTGLFNGIFRTFATLLIYRQKPNEFLWANLLSFLVIIGVSVSGLYYNPLSLDGPIYGRLISALGSFVWAISYFYRESKFRFSKKYLPDILRYSLPLYIYLILFWVVGNIDRYLILGLLSKEKVAIFDFAIKMTLLIEFVQNGLSSAVNPKVFRLWKEGGDIPESTPIINRYFNGFTAINTLFLPIFIISVPLLVPFLVQNAELYVSFALLPVLAAGLATRSWQIMVITPIFHFGKTRILPLVYLATAIVQIGLTYLLLLSMDLEGAMWANFASRVAQVVFLYLAVRRFYTFKVNVKKIVVLPLIYIMMVIISDLWLKNLIDFYLLNSLQFMVIAIFVYALFRKEVSSLSHVLGSKKSTQ